MNETINQTFSHAFWQPSDNVSDRISFQYKQHVFYFHRLKITQRERTLLSLLLTEVDHTPRPATAEEQEWSNYLYAVGEQPPNAGTFTALHFYIEQPIDDYDSFREAILSFFPISTLMIWESNTNGLLLFPSDYREYDLDALTELIESDFYTILYTFLGIPIHSNQCKTRLSFEKKLFLKQMDKKRSTHIFSATESSLAELKQQLHNTEFEQLRSHFLSNELLHDEELLHTITVFFKNNLNTSQTAKALHLHRNSLQYRLDKFNAQTGLDLRIFSHAALTHLFMHQPT
ncbi:PucR family transcriptional regulator [Shouchella miscanthi]|uniref:Helix-turn-helix domain-containing protein n=1 Tax=Shouchella miscanthi TaxID=2598861 RepID=A0ABU6NN85_9BACI|nr:helix-turn-helix domain-containing protein [Shouchella miscanthi]